MRKTLQPNSDNGPLPDAPSGPVEDATPDIPAPLVQDSAFYRDALVMVGWWLERDRPEEARRVISFALHGDRPPVPEEAQHLPLFEDVSHDQ